MTSRSCRLTAVQTASPPVRSTLVGLKPSWANAADSSIDDTSIPLDSSIIESESTQHRFKRSRSTASEDRSESMQPMNDQQLAPLSQPLGADSDDEKENSPANQPIAASAESASPEPCSRATDWINFRQRIQSHPAIAYEPHQALDHAQDAEASVAIQALALFAQSDDEGSLEEEEAPSSPEEDDQMSEAEADSIFASTRSAAVSSNQRQQAVSVSPPASSIDFDQPQPASTSHHPSAVVPARSPLSASCVCRTRWYLMHCYETFERILAENPPLRGEPAGWNDLRFAFVTMLEIMRAVCDFFDADFVCNGCLESLAPEWSDRFLTSGVARISGTTFCPTPTSWPPRV